MLILPHAERLSYHIRLQSAIKRIYKGYKLPIKGFVMIVVNLVLHNKFKLGDSATNSYRKSMFTHS